jgi:hypothetical protein
LEDHQPIRPQKYRAREKNRKKIKCSICHKEGDKKSRHKDPPLITINASETSTTAEISEISSEIHLISPNKTEKALKFEISHSSLNSESKKKASKNEKYLRDYKSFNRRCLTSNPVTLEPIIGNSHKDISEKLKFQKSIRNYFTNEKSQPMALPESKKDTAEKCSPPKPTHEKYFLPNNCVNPVQHEYKKLLVLDDLPVFDSIRYENKLQEDINFQLNQLALRLRPINISLDGSVSFEEEDFSFEWVYSKPTITKF